MRTLNFKVDKQHLSKVGDFENLIAGTEGYLLAEFEFSEDWKDMVKVATFTVSNDKEYASLIKDNVCVIPSEALKYKRIEVSVEGRASYERLTTNCVRMLQARGLE